MAGRSELGFAGCLGFTARFLFASSSFTDLNAASYNPLRAEGNVHIHPGIHGIGDVDPTVFGWNDPVTKITIRKK